MNLADALATKTYENGDTIVNQVSKSFSIII